MKTKIANELFHFAGTFNQYAVFIKIPGKVTWANSFFVPGIISTIAFCSSNSGILATGSYDHTTAIYREDNMELLYVLHGQEGGVTHVSWNI